MEIKYFSKSRPNHAETRGTPDQVFAGPTPISDLVNKISSGNCAATFGPDIYGRATHVFARSIRRNFSGKLVGIIGNASDVSGKFKLRYIPLSSVLCFTTLELESNAPVSNRAPGRPP